MKSQMDVRPSVLNRLRTMAFSRVSTGYSLIPSSCEMKDEPEFKEQLGKTAFFESGISGSIILEAQSTESLSHTYF